MNTELFVSSRFKAQPWKNGGGSTLELFRYPPNFADFIFRLSIADVTESGAFSTFEGYERTIVQLKGSPMTLSHLEAKTPRVLELFQPYIFDGDWKTDCKITGPAQDFNVICRKETWKSQTKVEEYLPGERLKASFTGKIVLAYCMTGKLKIDFPTYRQSIEIEAHQLCTFEDYSESYPAVIEASEPARLIIVACQQNCPT